MKPYNKNLKQASRDLRNNMTDVEKFLWSKIRNKQILGVQFYRQKPILNFIVDFYCPSANLVIECDGSQHYTDEGLEADRIRDHALEQLGLKVLRFDNRQVMGEIDAVVRVVLDVISLQLESP
ncbi:MULTISPECIES: endonuclease domain-containing protein [unclassified Acinetobacter]|uniref:endonuclease domain-containing protein n=1 Tax=unclassified Acinetobacter TaxID=196816 RepID=UPI0018A8DCA4|nr:MULTISPECIES: endonuclease domain-containing protein [unclassified Acinetobacter]MBJ9954209.1 endonuclease domain-containing protein [Acinetobacter baumannii]